jgi:flagellar hook-associated protein 1
MGNLIASLLNSAQGLEVYSQAMNVVENNVVNANTPGYAKQVMTFEAEPFDISVGLPGGVQAGQAQNTRNAYAEQAVRSEQSSYNYSNQKVTDLTPVQSTFNLSNTSGIGPDMTNLFNSFSALSVNPNDTVTRQSVLTAASTVAQDFNDAANGLYTQSSNLVQQTTSVIGSINQLASQIAQINGEFPVDPGGSVDAGVDAQLNSSLEQLAQLTNFTALQQPDGQVTVYIGGQTPLVVGAQTFAIQGTGSPPNAAILSSTGQDITSQITGGQLSALLDDQNNVLRGYLSKLNTLAQSLADQVNTTLDQGIDQNGAAPTNDLFTYNATTGAAETLAVNPLTPDQIAAALPGAAGGNGNALALANLANVSGTNGYTFEQYYGTIGGQVGSDLSSAQNDATTQQSLLNQAQTLRQQVSGVSLDEEAANLLEFERSYQAISKVVTVLNDVTDTLMNMVGIVTT